MEWLSGYSRWSPDTGAVIGSLIGQMGPVVSAFAP